MTTKTSPTILRLTMTWMMMMMTMSSSMTGVETRELCQICLCDMYGTVVDCRERGLHEAPLPTSAEHWMLNRVQTINLDGNRIRHVNALYWSQFTSLTFVSFRQRGCLHTQLPPGVRHQGEICEVSDVFLNCNVTGMFPYIYNIRPLFPVRCSLSSCNQ